MIGYIIGTVVSIEEQKVILEHNNMGFEVYMPLSSIQSKMVVGAKIKVHTYLHVKEDLLQLYGFVCKDDLEVFKLLITVNGIGPKGALGVLSGMSSDELRFAVLSEDVKMISKAPGIGKKTASKLILELKDKLNLEDAFEKKRSHVLESTEGTSKDVVKEGVEALVALGYSNGEALKTIRQIEGIQSLEVEEVLKIALKKMALI